MTVREAIRRADLLRPNTLAGEDKARWLRATDNGARSFRKEIATVT